MEILKYRKDANSPWQDVVALVGPQGQPGKDGEQGPQGVQGEPGKDGYTPVKGVDYFDGEKGEQGIQGIQGEPGKDGQDYILTEDDKAEIANIVLAAIPSSEEVTY